MEQGMEESDIEGLATHGGPESCVGVREGVGEALPGGVQAGPLSREMSIRGADAVNPAEGHTTGGVHPKPPEDLARSENHGM